MDNIEWRYYEEDKIGNSTKNAATKSLWLENINTGELALFKPDTGRLSCGFAEVCSHKIARGLDISSAQCTEFEWFGAKGVISFDYKIYDGRKYVPSCKFNIGENKGEFVIETPLSGEKHPIGLTMEVIHRDFPVLEEPICEMIFFDCLTKNIDRHSKNFEIMLDRDKNIIGLAPLFDHSLTIFNPVVQNTKLNRSLFLWEKDYPKITHFDMFEKLCKNYPDKTAQLMQKASNILDNKDFLPKETTYYLFQRFNQMGEIFIAALSGKKENISKNVSSKYLPEGFSVQKIQSSQLLKLVNLIDKKIVIPSPIVKDGETAIMYKKEYAPLINSALKTNLNEENSAKELFPRP